MAAQPRLRPTKLTPELAERIYELLRRGHYTRSACAYVGVSKSSLYNWLDKGASGRILVDQRPVREAFPTAADHRRALARWRAQLAREQLFADFADGVEMAQDFGEAWLVEQILEMVGDPAVKHQKWTALMTILERTRRDRWGRRSAVEHGTPDGKPFPVSHVIDPSKLSNEELDTLRSLLERAQPEQT